MTTTAPSSAPAATGAGERVPFDRRVPRALHPVAWWIWAVALGVTASRTTNPLLLMVILAVAAVVVAARRTDAPWARAFKYYLAIGLTVIAARVVFRAVFGGDDALDSHILFTLPRVPLPSWAAGIRLGGPVSGEGTLAAVYDGLRLATFLCCIGAANALANPKRALRVLPGALYELGVAVVVAVSVAPQLVESVQRVRRARRLRGGSGRGLRVLRSIAMPVLQDALERSLMLAAAMDSRGYGRRAGTRPATRRLTAALLIGGLLCLCLGVYGLLQATGDSAVRKGAFAAGVALCVAGLALGGRRVQHTRYRPDRWRAPEIAVVLCGLVPVYVLTHQPSSMLDQLYPPTNPLTWPALPIVPLIAILVAALPAVLAPPVPLGAGR